MLGKNSKKLCIGILAVSLAAAPVALSMTGCNSVRDIMSTTAIGEAIASSKNTDMSDRKDNYGHVQDVDGNEYTTVVWIDPADGSAVNVDNLKNVLEKAGVNWYQIIASNDNGTGIQEYGLLYFPPSATLGDMQTAVDALDAGKFSAHVMDQSEYDKYLEEAPGDELWNLKIYGHEITYYGPAAKS